MKAHAYNDNVDIRRGMKKITLTCYTDVNCVYKEKRESNVKNLNWLTKESSSHDVSQVDPTKEWLFSHHTTRKLNCYTRAPFN